jgi:hypothetical protein
MKRFVLFAALCMLALIAYGETASAQKRGGSVHRTHVGRYTRGRVHSLPRHLHGRTLAREYARFSRFRYDARYRCRFYLAGSSWYYYYAPYLCYLPVEVIVTYPPTVVTTPGEMAPVVDVPEVTGPFDQY